MAKPPARGHGHCRCPQPAPLSALAAPAGRRAEPSAVAQPCAPASLSSFHSPSCWWPWGPSRSGPAGSWGQGRGRFLSPSLGCQLPLTSRNPSCSQGRASEAIVAEVKALLQTHSQQLPPGTARHWHMAQSRCPPGCTAVGREGSARPEEPRWVAATGHRGAQKGARWHAGEEKGCPDAEKGEVRGGEFWAGDSSCHGGASPPFPKMAFPRVGCRH